jgi:hypothetical protein
MWVRDRPTHHQRQEPLGRIDLNRLNEPIPDSTTTIVAVRCWNDRGTMQFEAASQPDLKVNQPEATGLIPVDSWLVQMTHRNDTLRLFVFQHFANLGQQLILIVQPDSPFSVFPD